MRQFWHVFRFEYLNYVMGKGFLIVTLVMILVMGVTLFFPRLSAPTADKGAWDSPPPIRAPMPAALSDSDPALAAETLRMLTEKMPQYAFALVDGDVETLRRAVEAGTYTVAVAVSPPLSYVYIVNQLGLYDVSAAQIHDVMAARFRLGKLQRAGLSEADLAEVLAAPVAGTVVEIGKNQMTSFIYTYLLIFLLYMAIMLYGQFVANGVASEKSSRAMELLITSAKTQNLIFGKVLGAGLAGLTQLAALLGAGILFYSLNSAYWTDNAIIASIFSMPVSILLYTCLFFLLGFFLYAFLYGALSSLVSRMEELHSAVLPVTFVFLFSFFAVFIGTVSGRVDTPAMTVFSFIPFTAPMAMFVRISMSNPDAWEILLSVTLLAAANLACGYLASGIYRVGVLLYGKPPRPAELLRILRRARR
ncbi:MAG: ABC transporter permease [Oscillospiraceae bacterium]|jgi:ABC-2 type transport system permease protein|nr:ABC transporter permease [Oscillospiraceae bacterium]